MFGAVGCSHTACPAWYGAAMNEFFHGRRRKVGVASLALALAVMGLWFRSLNHVDGGAIQFSDQRGVTFGTRECGLYVRRYATLEPDMPEGPPENLFEFWTTPAGDNGDDGLDDWLWNPGCWIISSDLTFCGFRYARFGINAVEILLIPYWAIVLPLSLFSAYLILWKPRKRDSRSPQS